jgi:hypothetical protein
MRSPCNEIFIFHNKKYVCNLRKYHKGYHKHIEINGNEKGFSIKKAYM